MAEISPVFRVQVFLLAMPALLKGIHRGVAPVVRERSGNGIPWAAMNAGDKWIMIAPVVCIKQFLPAEFTHGQVRR